MDPLTLTFLAETLGTGSSVSSRIQKGHGATYNLGAPYHERRAPS